MCRISLVVLGCVFSFFALHLHPVGLCLYTSRSPGASLAGEKGLCSAWRGVLALSEGASGLETWLGRERTPSPRLGRGK